MIQVRIFAAGDAPAVQGRSTAVDPTIPDMSHRLIDDAYDRFPVMAERNQDTEVEQPGTELPCPVNRVQDPDKLLVEIFCTKLLAEDAVVRMTVSDQITEPSTAVSASVKAERSALYETAPSLNQAVRTISPAASARS